MSSDQSRLARSLELLRALNEARRIGQHDAAAELNMHLEALDNEAGYMRPIRVERIPTTGEQKVSGAQRNPNWRAALDKLNAMRGRSK